MKPQKLFFNRYFDTLFSLACIGFAVLGGANMTIIAGVVFFVWQGVATIAVIVANPLNSRDGPGALMGRVFFVGLISLGLVPAMFAAKEKLHPQPSKADQAWASRVTAADEVCPLYFQAKKEGKQPNYQFDFCNDYAAGPSAWKQKTAELLMKRGFKYESDSLSGRLAAEIAQIKANPNACQKYDGMTNAERGEVSYQIRDLCRKREIDAEPTASISSATLWK